MKFKSEYPEQSIGYYEDVVKFLQKRDDIDEAERKRLTLGVQKMIRSHLKEMGITYVPRFYVEDMKPTAEEKNIEYKNLLNKWSKASKGRFEFVPIQGDSNKDSDRQMIAYVYDGVQYAITVIRDTKDEMRDYIRKLDEIIKRHHIRIKRVYEYTKTKVDGPVWVMSGGGMQLQAFFGNETGYLAILYLDMEGSKKIIKDTDSYTLQVNWVKNDPLFEGADIPQIQIRTSFEVYGDKY